MMDNSDIEESYCSDILHSLYEFQQTGYLCDTVLIADDGERKAHSALLAAASLLFKQGLPASDKPMEHVIVLPGFPCHVVDIALHLIYCGTLDIPDKYLLEDGLTLITAALLKLGLQIPPTERYSVHILQTVYEFQQDSYLCDAVIVADDTRLKAHSSVLAAASQLFKQGLPASDKPMEHVIVLPGYTGSLVNIALCVIYCGHSQSLHSQPLVIPALHKLGLKLPADSCVDEVNNVINTGCTSVKHCSIVESATRESNSRQDSVAIANSIDQVPADGHRGPTSDSTSTSLTTTSGFEVVVIKVEQTDEFDQKTSTQTDTSDNKTETTNKKQTTQKQKHGSRPVGKLKCKVCGSKFTTRGHLRQHGKVHLRPPRTHYECSVCNARISRSNMKRHMRRHTGEGKTSGKTQQENNVESGSEREEGRFECEICGLKLSSAGHLGQHSKVHNKTTKTVFECEICRAKLSNRHNLKRHLSLHDGERSYMCQDCGAGFTRMSFLKDHIRTTHPDSSAPDTPAKTFPCASCNETFQRQYQLKEHQMTAHNATAPPTGLTNHQLRPRRHKLPTLELPYICPVCYRRFAMMQTLYAHMRAHDELKQEIEKQETEKHRSFSFQCVECLKCFSGKQALMTHRNTIHSDLRPYNCLLCSARFKMKHCLELHVGRIHSEVRPYLCTVCGRSFAFDVDLNSHLLVHSDVRPFQCSMCTSSFKTKSSLRLHVDHIHSGARPFQCTVCGQAFAYQYVLRDHMLIHTGERRHMCATCGKKFAVRNALVKHERIHTGEKPYECVVCHQRFRRSTHRRRHMIKHSDIPREQRLHRCTLCDKPFSSTYRLQLHSLRVHNVELRKFRRGQQPGTVVANNSPGNPPTASGNPPVPPTASGNPAGIDANCAVSCSSNISNIAPVAVAAVAETSEHVCQTCGKKFAFRYILAQHEKVHSVDTLRPYECTVCGLTFRLLHHLTRHKLIHCAQRPVYQCMLCNKVYKNKESLRLHSSRDHKVELPKESRTVPTNTRTSASNDNLSETDCPVITSMDRNLSMDRMAPAEHTLSMERDLSRNNVSLDHHHSSADRTSMFQNLSMDHLTVNRSQNLSMDHVSMFRNLSMDHASISMDNNVIHHGEHHSGIHRSTILHSNQIL